MENGEPFCNHCEKHFVPRNLTRIACTNCGCGQPNDDHGALDHLFADGDLENSHVASNKKKLREDLARAMSMGDLSENEEYAKAQKALMEHVEGPTVADEVAGEHIVKQESRYSFVDTALEAFYKQANDSQLYYRGYNDAQAGKPLDEDLALLSDDYFHGYEQYKFYNKTPQQSTGQKLYDLKPNSNAIPRGGQMTPGEADRGPLELTDGFNHATASVRLASIFPNDVIQKFFEV